MITSLSNFKRRRKNRKEGYKLALSLSWPIRDTYLDHVTFSNKSSVCTGETSQPCLQITCFRENNGCGLDFEKADGFGIAEEVISVVPTRTVSIDKSLKDKGYSEIYQAN